MMTNNQIQLVMHARNTTNRLHVPSRPSTNKQETRCITGHRPPAVMTAGVAMWLTQRT